MCYIQKVAGSIRYRSVPVPYGTPSPIVEKGHRQDRKWRETSGSNSVSIAS